MMTRSLRRVAAVLAVATLAVGPLRAQTPAAPKPAAPATLSDHVRTDIVRHRAMAAAHEAAARCLEAGRPEADCQKELAVACKGLAIGKHCGMRHEH